MEQQKVKAALDDITSEKFDKVADQILAIVTQSKDGRTLKQVTQLIFEKAIGAVTLDPNVGGDLITELLLCVTGML